MFAKYILRQIDIPTMRKILYFCPQNQDYDRKLPRIPSFRPSVFTGDNSTAYLHRFLCRIHKHHSGNGYGNIIRRIYGNGATDKCR